MALHFPDTSFTYNSSTDQLEVSGQFRSDPTLWCAAHTQNDINANITTANGRPITWNQEAYDYQAAMSTTQYTVPRDGTYWVYLWMMDDNDGTNVQDYYDIQVNNTIGFARGARGYSTGNSNHHHQWPCGGIFRLYSGDTVRVYVQRMDTGLYGSDHHYTQFNICYLGWG